MLNKSSFKLFVTAALALSTVAHPRHLRRNVESFKTISLSKRVSLTGEDGVFNSEEAMRSARITRHKHEQNLINLQRNMDGSGSLELVDSVTDSAAREGSEPLVDQEQDIEWTGFVSIGSPAKTFNLDFDTGSADLWLPTTKCTSSNCAGKRKYNPYLSRTSKIKSGHFSIQYGDASTVSGSVYTDTVNVAGIKVENQYLGGATELSSLFKSTPEDGLLGLAFPSISTLNKTSFFWNAIAQKAVRSPVFAFRLASDNSELHLGGVNSRLYSGAIEYHPVVNLPGYSTRSFWQLGNAQVHMNGKRGVVQDVQTFIDSGTTLMFGPTEEVEKIYAQVEGSQKLAQFPGLYGFPCDSMPRLSFSWGGREWPIGADNFNLGLLEAGSETCVGALGAQDLSYGKKIWLLGDSFMKNVYTVFIASNSPSVGFAELR